MASAVSSTSAQSTHNYSEECQTPRCLGSRELIIKTSETVKSLTIGNLAVKLWDGRFIYVMNEKTEQFLKSLNGGSLPQYICLGEEGPSVPFKIKVVSCVANTPSIDKKS